MLHQVIETLNWRVALRPRYENFIGGKWVAPSGADYFDNVSPMTGKTVSRSRVRKPPISSLRSTRRIEAKNAWGKTAPAKRAEILNKIADRMEETLKVLAAVETIDNGKPIRETTFAVPLAIDHFRYFAACTAPRKDRCRISMPTPSPTTITSRSAWSADYPVELPNSHGCVEARPCARRGRTASAPKCPADRS